MIETISPLIFPNAVPIRRDVAVPETLQGPDYHDKYDFSTLIYDAVSVPETQQTVLVCPKLFNFESLLDEGGFLDGAGERVAHRVLHHRRYDEIWLASPASTFSFIYKNQIFPISVATESSKPFSDKRCIVTVSRNNEIPWIIDWLTFYKVRHGLEAGSSHSHLQGMQLQM